MKIVTGLSVWRRLLVVVLLTIGASQAALAQ
jgi:hypothetical protein